MSLKDRLNVLRSPKKPEPPPVPNIAYIETERILPYLGMVLLLGASYLLVILFKQYLWPTFLSFLLYIGFYHFNNKLSYFLSKGKETSVTKTWSAMISTTLSFLLIVLPSVLLVKQLANEGYWLFSQAHYIFSNEEVWDRLTNIPFVSSLIATQPFFWVDIVNILNEASEDFGKYLNVDQIGSWVGNLFRFIRGGVSFTLSLLYNLLLVMILLFFLFRDGPALYQAVKRALPFPESITDHFTHQMQCTITDVLNGNIFVSLLQGAALGFALLLCGFESVVSYGAIAALFSVIPVIGTAVIWFPSSLYLAFVEQRYVSAFLLSIYGLGVYSVLENILKPKLLVAKLGIHPLFLFFSILGGITEFGIPGAIIGPLFLVLFKTIWNIYHIWEPRKKIVPKKENSSDSEQNKQ